MVLSVTLVLRILAFVCFTIAFFNVPSRLSFRDGGFAFLTLSLILA